MILHGDHEGVLQARGTALHDAQGRGIGAVMVLNDVTDFRRLEHIRRDFVANVSHELKTPITSIKGFVETLLDGAMHNPDDAERFLQIVAKQADRLNAIIEDLLSLSKIEQGEEAGDIVLERGRVEGCSIGAVHDCQPKAAERQDPGLHGLRRRHHGPDQPPAAGAGGDQPARQRHQVQRAGQRSAGARPASPTTK